MVYVDEDEDEEEAGGNESVVGKVEAAVEGGKEDEQDVEVDVSEEEKEVEKTIFNCELCDKSFKTDEAYKAHMKSKAHRQMEKSSKGKKKGFVRRGTEKEY